jgi:uncharacterized RDD family membrane protein YckC
MRVIAHFIDAAILMAASWLGLLAILGSWFWIKRLGFELPEGVPPLARQGILWTFYTLASVPYYVIGHHRFGTTIGKYPFGMQVRRARDPGERISVAQAFGRYVGYAISSLPLCAGYLLAGVHPRKQALHDLIAGTVVIRT